MRADVEHTKPVVFEGSGLYLRTVRERVNERLANRHAAGCARIQRKAVLIVLAFLLSYAALLSAHSIWLQLPLAVVYGLAACAIGLNIFHDANHGSLSADPRVNKLAAIASSTALGASRYLWIYKHHVLHHRFTNIYRWDDDLEPRGWLRFTPSQSWERRYYGQQFYFVFLYLFNTIEWFFIKDFVQFFTLRMSPHRTIPAMSPVEKCEFWASKLTYFALFVALPFAVMPAWRACLVLVVFHFTFGLTLTLIFNLAHLVEPAAFPVPEQGSAKIGEEWAAHQMRTTTNFAGRNALCNWFSGGLNHQIEHHLFPLVSHTLYAEISGVVRQTAEEFKLPYLELETYRDALASHFRLLKTLSVDG